MTSKRWLATVCASLSLVALVFAVTLLRAIAIVRRTNYPAIVADPSVELQDRPFHDRDRRCDVLIDGDSTAAIGVDPRIITVRTGLSACNIATSRPIVDDLGTLSLDTFLEHNPKPRLLVLQYGAEDFYQSSQPWAHVGSYAPLVMVVRNFPVASALWVMVKHPAETVQFVFFAMKQYYVQQPGRTEIARSRYEKAMSHAAASNGQMDLGFQSETGCAPHPLPLNGPLDAGRIRQLRMRYERQGIAVLIRAAPVPSCDLLLTRFERDLSPYLDGAMEALPVGLFASGDRHLTPTGSRVGTQSLTDFITVHEPSLLSLPARLQGLRPLP